MTQLLKIEDRLNLEKRLANIPEVARFDVPGEPQSSTIAHGLADIQESCLKVATELIPLLKNTSASNDDIVDILLQLGDEFKHIVYHIRDQKFFEYVMFGSEIGKSR